MKYEGAEDIVCIKMFIVKIVKMVKTNQLSCKLKLPLRVLYKNSKTMYTVILKYCVMMTKIAIRGYSYSTLTNSPSRAFDRPLWHLVYRNYRHTPCPNCYCNIFPLFLVLYSFVRGHQ